MKSRLQMAVLAVTMAAHRPGAPQAFAQGAGTLPCWDHFTRDVRTSEDLT